MGKSEFACPPPVNSGRERFGESFNQLQVESKISASHVKPLSHAHPVVTPIYHATTYRFDSVSQFNQTNHGSNYIYQRCGNPTVDNVAVIIRELEQGAATMMYNSGLAACSAVLLEFLNAGDHLICMKPIYSGSYSFINETLPRFNVDVQFINVDKVKDFAAAVEAAIKKNTKMVFFEIIANPSMAMPDLTAVIAVAKKHNIYCFVDATFVSPVCVQPITLGADFCMHSCSKYMGGHTDVIAGCVTTKSMKDWERLKIQQLTTGSTLSPWGAAFVARGLQTLPLRVDKICSNALAVAQFLEKHPKVRHVSYAGLESHPGHKAALKYMKKFGGMMAFDVGSAEAAYKVVETVRLIVHAVSLGGTESLMEHPASMTHGKELVRNEKEPIVNPGLIRLSVGIENVEDIINDLNRALALI